MSTQKNKRHQFPHSLLAHLKTSLGDRFTVLPERVQQGYTKLLWDNQYITKANQHTKNSASWKTSAETLKLLFGDPQIFRDVNTNGFYINQRLMKYKKALIPHKYPSFPLQKAVKKHYILLK